jgi:hypothetical protein
MKSISQLVFCFLCLSLVCSCNRVDPVLLALEGSYSGTIFIEEETWSYQEGTLNQDTLYQTLFAEEQIEIMIRKDQYEVCRESGTLVTEANQLVFITNEVAADTAGCPPFFASFPQYSYTFSQEGDSLKLDLLEEGIIELFGARNREAIRITRRLRVVRE